MTRNSGPNEQAAGPGIVEGEFLLTASDFKTIAQIVHAHAGIYLPEGKAALVYSRLAKRLRTLGLRNFREYCKLVETADGVDERQAMTAALTTNVTRFMREPHHFEHLEHEVLPALVRRARAGGRVRLWSCSARTTVRAWRRRRARSTCSRRRAGRRSTAAASTRSSPSSSTAA